MRANSLRWLPAIPAAAETPTLSWAIKAAQPSVRQPARSLWPIIAESWQGTISTENSYDEHAQYSGGTINPNKRNCLRDGSERRWTTVSLLRRKLSCPGCNSAVGKRSARRQSPEYKVSFRSGRTVLLIPVGRPRLPNASRFHCSCTAFPKGCHTKRRWKDTGKVCGCQARDQRGFAKPDCGMRQRRASGTTRHSDGGAPQYRFLFR